MGDNRPTVGFIVMSWRVGPLSWNSEEQSLFSSAPSCQVFPTKAMANRAILATLKYARKQKYSWRATDYEVHRLVTARQMVAP